MKPSHLLSLAMFSLSACSQGSGAHQDPPPSMAASNASPNSNAPAAAPAALEMHEGAIYAPPRFAVPVEGLPMLGREDAPVTIVEFADYDCTFCRVLETTMGILREKHGTDLRVVVAQHPLPMHPRARAAGLAALAADRRGKFDEMHYLLFQREARHSPEDLAAYGRELGLGNDVARSENDPALGAALARAIALGESLHVKGIPTMFINGRKVSGAQPFDVIERIVDEELRFANGLVAEGVRPRDVYTRIQEIAQRNPVVNSDDAEPEGPVMVPAAKNVGGAHLLGPDKGAHQLVVFTDLECTYCARFDGSLRSWSETHPDVSVVVRHNPLPIHANARLAARGAIAAEAQGNLVAFVALAFQNQTALDRAGLIRLATQLGLDVDRFNRDLDAETTTRRLEEDEALARKVGVRGTPTSYLDGQQIVGAQKMSLFDAALAASK